MTQLSFEKGTRNGDSIIREKVNSIMEEVEEFYRTIRVFASGKRGDISAFDDILDYFNGRFLDNYQLPVKIDQLKKELTLQAIPDNKRGVQHSGKSHERKINLFVKKLEEDLIEWQRILLDSAEPLLRGFLADINDIVLYYRIENKIGRIITNKDVFAPSGDNYQDFKISIGYYVQVHMKL